MHTSKLFPNVDWGDALMLQKLDDDTLIRFALFATFKHCQVPTVVRSNKVWQGEMLIQSLSLAQHTLCTPIVHSKSPFL